MRFEVQNLALKLEGVEERPGGVGDEKFFGGIEIDEAQTGRLEHRQLCERQLREPKKHQHREDHTKGGCSAELSSASGVPVAEAARCSHPLTRRFTALLRQTWFESRFELRARNRRAERGVLQSRLERTGLDRRLEVVFPRAIRTPCTPRAPVESFHAEYLAKWSWFIAD